MKKSNIIYIFRNFLRPGYIEELHEIDGLIILLFNKYFHLRIKVK